MKWGMASKIAAIFSLLALVGTLIVGLVITEASSVLLIDASAKRLSHVTQIVGIQLANILDNLRSDESFITRTLVVKETARHEPSAVSPSVGPRANTHWREFVTASFTAFLESRPWYRELRLVGIADKGREIVRVKQTPTGIVQVPEDQLSQQGNAPDFRLAISLPEGSLYLSRIALAREQDRVIEPHIPTMQASMPIYGPEGRRFGVLTISVDMGRIFKLLSGLIDADSTLFIANHEGDFLYHPDPTKTFGFEFGHRYRLTELVPQTAALLKGDGKAILLHKVAWVPGHPQIGYFERFSYQAAGGHPLLVLGLTSPRAVILKDVNAVRRRSAAYTLLFALSGIVLVLFVSHRLTAPLRQITRAVARLGRGDSQLLLPVGGSDEVGILAESFRLLAERINRQLTALEEKEARLRSIIETAVDGIIVINERRIIEAFNPAAERLFGYRSAEVTGRNVSMLMPSPDREQHDQYISRYLETGERHIIGIGRLVYARHKDGHILPLYLSIGEFTLAGERKFTGILHDVSTDQRLQQALAATPGPSSG